MLHIRSQAAKRNARKLPGKELLGAAVFQSSSARQWGKVLVQLGAQWGKEKSRADVWAGDFLDFFLRLNIQSIVRSCSPPSSLPVLFEYFCYVTVKYVVLYITKDILGVSKGEGWGEWWANTMDAVASSSTLEVLQEVLNQFFAPVLRRKSDPCRLVGNYLTRSTWSLLMSPETQGCLSNRNSAHEKTQIRHLERCGPQEETRWLLSGPPKLLEKALPMSRDSSRSPGRFQEWHWLQVESQCYFSVDLFSIHSSSPSSSGYN